MCVCSALRAAQAKNDAPKMQRAGWATHVQLKMKRRQGPHLHPPFIGLALCAGAPMITPLLLVTCDDREHEHEPDHDMDIIQSGVIT